MGGIEFQGIADGDTVQSPVSVDFATTGDFEIIPAADGGGDGAGHMHVMVDTGCVAVGEIIPSDDTHVHFGDGSTSAELELEPGEHDPVPAGRRRRPHRDGRHRRDHDHRRVTTPRTTAPTTCSGAVVVQARPFRPPVLTR